MSGEIEIDETYVGGKRKGRPGHGAGGKTVVLEIKKRGGGIMTRVVPDARRHTIEPLIRKNVTPGSSVSTDERWRGLGTHGYHHTEDRLPRK